MLLKVGNHCLNGNIKNVGRDKEDVDRPWFPSVHEVGENSTGKPEKLFIFESLFRTVPYSFHCALSKLLPQSLYRHLLMSSGNKVLIVGIGEKEKEEQKRKRKTQETHLKDVGCIRNISASIQQ